MLKGLDALQSACGYVASTPNKNKLRSLIRSERHITAKTAYTPRLKGFNIKSIEEVREAHCWEGELALALPAPDYLSVTNTFTRDILFRALRMCREAQARKWRNWQTRQT